LFGQIAYTRKSAPPPVATAPAPTSLFGMVLGVFNPNTYLGPSKATTEADAKRKQDALDAALKYEETEQRRAVRHNLRKVQRVFSVYMSVFSMHMRVCSVCT
jgi:hypothetical protein